MKMLIVIFLLMMLMSTGCQYTPSEDSQEGVSTTSSQCPDISGMYNSEEISSIRLKAEQGDVIAQNTIGAIYANGLGVSQDYKEAFYWYEKAAQQGFGVAQSNLSRMYVFGRGIPLDYKKAFYWQTKAAEQGYAIAQYDLGVTYQKGAGIPQDYKKAIHWYIKSGEQGFPPAKNNLSALIRESKNNIKSSAEQGDAEAQFILGFMYLRGEGVFKSKKQAYQWFTKAAEKGNAEAQLKLGAMYFTEDEPDLKQAFYWITKASEQGLPLAQQLLGNMYFSGTGVPENDKQGLHWMTKSAEQGIPESQNSLGKAYLHNIVFKDEKQASYWFIKAGKQGHAESQLLIGMLYYLGKGVAKDYIRSCAWLLLAERNGNKDAKNFLDKTRKDRSFGTLTPSQANECEKLSRELETKYLCIEK